MTFDLGACVLEVDGGRVTCRYRADAVPAGEPAIVEDTVLGLLGRRADPYELGDARLAETLATIRAGLDGWYGDRTALVRFFRGAPVELAHDVECGEAGRWNHRCGEGCVGPVDHAWCLQRAERVCGPLVVGEWRWSDSPDDPFAARLSAPCRPA